MIMIMSSISLHHDDDDDDDQSSLSNFCGENATREVCSGVAGVKGCVYNLFQ